MQKKTVRAHTVSDYFIVTIVGFYVIIWLGLAITGRATGFILLLSTLIGTILITIMTRHLLTSFAKRR